MRDSIIFILLFMLGIFSGIYFEIPPIFYSDKSATWLLYVLLLFVGVSIGSDEQFIFMIKSFKLKYFLLPFIIIIASLSGGIIIYYIGVENISLRDSLAISSGFGYYSLSSIMITKSAGSDVGLIALISNIAREVLTLLFAPLIARYISKIGPIASGGATSMDTTLPFVIKYSGKDYAILSITNGIVLSLMVPVLITLIYNF